LTNKRIKQNFFITLISGGLRWHESESEVEGETETEGVEEDERRKCEIMEKREKGFGHYKERNKDDAR
jgi:hypothetical protein